MAFDIFLKLISMDYEIEKKIEMLEYKCVLIANKYFNWSEMNTDDFGEDIIDFVNDENMIYKMLQGRINEERYFSKCKNLEQVVKFLDVMITPEHISTYLQHDGKEFLSEYGIDKLSGSKTTFEVRIKDLVRSI